MLLRCAASQAACAISNRFLIGKVFFKRLCLLAAQNVVIGQKNDASADKKFNPDQFVKQ